jgi:hypothetical protein
MWAQDFEPLQDGAPSGAIEVEASNITGVLTPEGSHRIAYSDAMGCSALVIGYGVQIGMLSRNQIP